MEEENKLKFEILLNRNKTTWEIGKSVNPIFISDLIIENTEFIKMEYIELEGNSITFKDCLFQESYLSGSIFRFNSRFDNCIFINSKMSKTIFEGNISNCKFINCDFFKTELNGSTISNSIFVNCDFSSVSLCFLKLMKTQFLYSKNLNVDSKKNNEEDDVLWYP